MYMGLVLQSGRLSPCNKGRLAQPVLAQLQPLLAAVAADITADFWRAGVATRFVCLSHFPGLKPTRHAWAHSVRIRQP